MSNQIAIKAENLVKKYDQDKKGDGKITALAGVTFEVKKGEIFGFIGPDGAGKTSLFRILTTLLLPEEGTATVHGLDIKDDFKEIRNSIGYMPGKFALYQDLTVGENLNLFASIFKTTIEANYDLIKDIYEQIAPFKDRRAGNLSGGMKQKLGLSCALIHKPKILILDEPTTGVDAVSRKEFWEMLRKLRDGGLTILVSTPYMDEAEQCDKVALMQEGKILSIDTPTGITEKFEKPIWAVKGKDMYQILQDLRAFDETDSCFAFGESHHLVLKNEKTDAKAIHAYLLSKEHEGLSVERIKPGIEDTFMDLMLHES
ncbi:MAG: ABC transporter ATP-binding protein [Saprospiraceae bacterium]